MTTTGEKPDPALVRGRVEPLPDDPYLTSPFRDDPYSQLPLTGSHEAGVGHALITLAEPQPGHESRYNRWYEDTHFFDSALQAPWLFAGRRWVAPYFLQPLRYPANSPVLTPLESGKYLGTYWITKDRLEDYRNWIAATNARHRAIGNEVTERQMVFTTLNDAAGNVYRDAGVPRARHALHDPAAGLVLQVVDAPTREGRDDLERWLLDEYLPSRVTPGGPVSLAMVFRLLPPKPFYHGPRSFEMLRQVTNDERRLTILWFLTEDPREVWQAHFTREVEHLAAGGKGVTSLVAPFIPSKMGTSLYEDQLRGPPAAAPRPVNHR
jgi:hypothetical protein